jgi:hypothetical protein
MWGRATLTMVVSRTTMSWEVKITKRNTVGILSRRRLRSDQPGFGLAAGAGRDPRMAREGIVVRSFRWYRG